MKGNERLSPAAAEMLLHLDCLETYGHPAVETYAALQWPRGISTRDYNTSTDTEIKYAFGDYHQASSHA